MGGGGQYFVSLYLGGGMKIFDVSSNYHTTTHQLLFTTPIIIVMHFTFEYFKEYNDMVLPSIKLLPRCHGRRRHIMKT